MDKVIIVRAGGYGELSAEAGSYDLLIESLKETIGFISENKRSPHEKVEVQVVESVDQAKKSAMEMPLNYSFAVLFLTRGLIEKAKNLKRELTAAGRKGRVVLLTGLFPKEDEIIILSKAWINFDLIEEAIMP